MKWRLRDKRRNFTLMTCHYPVWIVLLTGWSKFPSQLNQKEALPRSGYWHVISIECLRSFLRWSFLGQTCWMAWWNVGCFLRLVIVKKYFLTGIFTKRKGGVTWQAFRARIMKFQVLANEVFIVIQRGESVSFAKIHAICFRDKTRK